MCKQCVPGSFLSTHALEPGNEASQKGAEWQENGQLWIIDCENTVKAYLPEKNVVDLNGILFSLHRLRQACYSKCYDDAVKYQ